MAHLLPVLKQQFFDSNGDPLVGGKLYSYAAGTSTPLATYADAAETTPNANPVILDANGEADIFIGSSAYKFVLTTAADVTLRTVDNVSHIRDLSVITGMLADGVLSADAEGLAKMSAGYLSATIDGLAKMAAGYFQASANGLAKFADGFFTADATGRAKFADGIFTKSKLAALGQQVSASSGNYSSGALGADVTNLSVTITTTGRPVFVGLIPDGHATNASNLGVSTASGTVIGAGFRIYRDATVVAYHYVQVKGPSGAHELLVPSSSVSTVDVVAAGTYTYKVESLTVDTAHVKYAKLIAFEYG